MTFSNYIRTVIFSVMFVTGRQQRIIIHISVFSRGQWGKGTDCFWQVANRVQRTVSAMTSGSICKRAHFNYRWDGPGLSSSRDEKEMKWGDELLKVGRKECLARGILLLVFSCSLDLSVLCLNKFHRSDTLFSQNGWVMHSDIAVANTP